MFEQSLYNQEAFAPVPEAHEGDLFYKYEIKNWNLGSRIYKILVASALVNILFFAFVAQTDLLTRKGCESPITSTVCQVIDMAFVADTIFGTKRDYVDEVYEKTSLKDADVTFVDVSNAEPQLEYPEGYFALANPEQAAMLAQLNNTNSVYTLPLPIPQNDLLHTTPIIPKANPNAIDGDIPTSPLGDLTDNSNSSGGINRKIRGPRFPGVKSGNDNSVTGNQTANSNPNKQTNTNSSTAASSSAPPVDEAKQDQFGVYINKRPLKDQAKETIALVDANTVKLDDSFKVVIAATLGLGKDGKTIVLKDPKLMPVDKSTPNNAELANLAQTWILRVGDDGWFGYLDRLGDKNKFKSRQVVISVEQNETDFKVSVRSQQSSEEEARTNASSLSLLILGAAAIAKGDEQMFLQAAKTTSDGKALVLNVEFKKSDVQEMIQRKLAESKEPQPTPTSAAATQSGGESQSK